MRKILFLLLAFSFSLSIFAQRPELLSKSAQKKITALQTENGNLKQQLAASKQAVKGHKETLADLDAARKKYKATIDFLKKKKCFLALHYIAKKEEADRIAATGGTIDIKKQQLRRIQADLDFLLRKLNKLKLQ